MPQTAKSRLCRNPGAASCFAGLGLKTCGQNRSTCAAPVAGSHRRVNAVAPETSLSSRGQSAPSLSGQPLVGYAVVMPSDRTSAVARRVADVLRAAVLVSGILMLVQGSFGAAIGFAVVFGVLLAARVLEVPPLFDAAFCLALLVAVWAGEQKWYTSIFWMDEVVHLIATGATAAASYLMLARLEMLPDAAEQLRAARSFSLILLVTILGLGLAAVWEFLEWISQQIAPKDTVVGYTDTILDMALGGLGAAAAGLLLLLWVRRRATVNATS